MAENSAVCRSAGAWRRIASTWGRHADVEHAVGFVDHQDAEFVDVQVAAFHQVQHASWRSHHDLRALGECAALRVVAQPADDAQRRRGRWIEQGVDDRPDLLGELTGRRQHQGLDAWEIGVKAFNDRDGVGQRLAGPGPGLPHDIAPFEQGRNARNLDGGGIDDLVGSQRVD